MTPREAWSVHWTTILVTVTGLLYAWYRYVAEPVDEFAIQHPLQPHFQHAHVLAAPLLIFAIGLVWKEHIWKHLVGGVPSRRRSGLLLLATLVPMIGSGYLLQTTVDPTWRAVWMWTHWISSVLWVLGWGGHVLARRMKRSRRRGEPRPIPESELRDPESEVGTLAARSTAGER